MTADMVLLHRNPLDNTGAVRDVGAVVRSGRVVAGG
jgi:hypothetical protein